MDDVTLHKMVDEVFEVAEWFGISPENANGEMFGLGAVAAKYRLLGKTDEIERLAEAVDLRIGQAVYAEHLNTLIRFAYHPN